MKKLILIFSILLTTSVLFAQNPIKEKQLQFNAGFGLSSWGIPIYIGLDYGIHKDITVGGELSFRSYHEDWRDYDYHHNVTGLTANGNYHFNSLLEIPSEWDFYAGLNLGFFIWDSDSQYKGNHSSGLELGIQIGGRYYLTNKIGINLEFGGGGAFSGGKIGISIKL